MGLLGLKVTLALFVLALTEGKDLHQYRSLLSAECDNGEAVFDLFAECGVDSLNDANDAMYFYTPTKEAVVQYLKSYCGDVLPSTKECFAQNISACNSDYIQQLVDSTGFHCQPGGTEPNIVLMYLLDRLEGELTPAGDGNVENVTVQDEDDVGNFSMPDLAGNFSIPYGMPFGECYHVLPQPCYDEAASKNELGMDKLSSYTLEQIVPRAQNFVRDLVECAIDYHKAREDTCPNWRGIALLTIARDVVPSILGTSFPFTKEQMIDMLEISD